MNPKALTSVPARAPKTLSTQSITILNDRLVDEYTAHFFYRIAANWCKNAAYNKAGAFFEAEAVSELEHAGKLQQYLVDWNTIPTMPSVKPNIAFTNLIDIVNKAYALEFGLFEKYNADSAKVFQSDLTTFDFLGEFRNTQLQAVTEYSDLLNAAVLVDTENRLDILYFEQTYF